VPVCCIQLDRQVKNSPEKREEKIEEKTGKGMDAACDTFTLVNCSLHAKRDCRIIALKRRANYLSMSENKQPRRVTSRSDHVSVRVRAMGKASV